jgi:hypothetical protein
MRDPARCSVVLALLRAGMSYLRPCVLDTPQPSQKESPPCRWWAKNSNVSEKKNISNMKEEGQLIEYAAEWNIRLDTEHAVSVFLLRQVSLSLSFKSTSFDKVVWSLHISRCPWHSLMTKTETQTIFFQNNSFNPLRSFSLYFFKLFEFNYIVSKVVSVKQLLDYVHPGFFLFQILFYFFEFIWVYIFLYFFCTRAV